MSTLSLRRPVNEARAGYSFIRADMFGRNPIRDSDIGIKRANAAAYPGLGLIRIGAAGTNSLAIGNSGANVDTESAQSSITLADVLAINHGAHSFRLGGEILFYQDRIATNNNRRGQVIFQTFNNFLIGQANNSTYGDGIVARTIRASDYSFFFQDDWRADTKAKPESWLALRVRSATVRDERSTLDLRSGALSTAHGS